MDEFKNLDQEVATRVSEAELVTDKLGRVADAVGTGLKKNAKTAGKIVAGTVLAAGLAGGLVGCDNSTSPVRQQQPPQLTHLEKLDIINETLSNIVGNPDMANHSLWPSNNGLPGPGTQLHAEGVVRNIGVKLMREIVDQMRGDGMSMDAIVKLCATTGIPLNIVLNEIDSGKTLRIFGGGNFGNSPHNLNNNNPPATQVADDVAVGSGGIGNQMRTDSSSVLWRPQIVDAPAGERHFHMRFVSFQIKGKNMAFENELGQPITIFGVPISAVKSNTVTDK